MLVETGTVPIFVSTKMGLSPLPRICPIHVGEQNFILTSVPRTTVRAKTWSFNVDLKAPVTQRFGVLGEFFTGDNLGDYLGSIGQGFKFTTRETIYSPRGYLNERATKAHNMKKTTDP
jgi:hypothetical protein